MFRALTNAGHFVRRWLPLGGLAALVFLGALLWANGRDPFARVWFTVKAEDCPRADCVAVLPQNAPRPYPVVVYLHGSGGNVLSSGNDLRQMAEIGLAVVGMDYCQTNEAVCEAQFAALLRYLGRQKWSDTNAVAWIGFSLGAEKVTRFWLKHTEARPHLLVRLAGGGLETLEWRREKEEGRTPDGATSKIQHSTLNDEARGQALLGDPTTGRKGKVQLVHGDQDEVFPVAEARGMEAVLRTNGVPVELKVLPGQPHNLGASRAQVFRAIGEYCLTHLGGAEALVRYRSIGAWQANAWPLWVFWLPALVWGSIWVVCGRVACPGEQKAESRKQQSEFGGKIVRGLATVLALAAVALTAVHLGTPRLAVNERTLAVARKFLVQPKEREDFEYLAALPCWRGQLLRSLLEHAHLARYNRSLVNWAVDDTVYREFVLSPVIREEGREDLRWRRALWESLYPRIRKEQAVEGAAEIVVRHLRERVTITAGNGWTRDIADVWQRQVTDAAGFQRLTVAGLRSVGIPARLDGDGCAEMLLDTRWQPAPRPLFEIW